jgi:type I restriction enzyme M protein
MLQDVNIVLTTNTAQLTCDAVNWIDVSVANEGSLPLRDVMVIVTPIARRTEKPHLELGYLAEGQKQDVQVEIGSVSAQSNSRIVLVAAWGAKTMDDKRIDGVTELAFDIVDSIGSQTESLTFGTSPYICGAPVLPKYQSVFFGRSELLESIKRQVMTGNVVLLEGNRRAGKTSILKHLEGADSVAGWLGVYTSLQGADDVSTVKVFRMLAREVASTVHAAGIEIQLPDGTTLAPEENKFRIVRACRDGISEEDPFSEFLAYFEAVLSTLESHDLKLLLMLDEFDKLQEGIDEGITSPQVPENIRFLVQNYHGVSAVLTGSRRLKRLREEYWSALYGLGTRFSVTYLDQVAARSLVVEPVKGLLVYSEEAIKRAIYLTSGQPYLLQCLCNRIFDTAAQLKANSITLDIVNRSATKLIEHNEHFASLWDYAGSELKRVLLIICHQGADGPDPLRLGVIQEQLNMNGLEVEDNEIVENLDFLRELELIELVGEGSSGHYELSIPLMGIWIDRDRDTDAVISAARIETEGRNE